MDELFDYLVVGNGLIGSAAGRYLSERTGRVALVGPDEPQNWATHRGVFASHYDQGRITRILDSRLAWGEWAQRSIAVYRELERRSGIDFFYSVGMVQVGPVGDYLAAVTAVGERLGATFRRFSAAEFQAVAPSLRFPAAFDCLLETETAGYVNPRSLVAAQLKVAMAQGATVVRETVTAVLPRADHVEVQTDQGQTVRARKVLLAAGAYSNRLLDEKLPLILKPRTILLAEVSGAELERLSSLPAVIYYDGLPSEELESVYMLPPIRYPNGRFYLKIGGDMRGLVAPETDEPLNAWFNQGGSKREAAALREVMEAIVPNLRADSFDHKPCVVTYTPEKRPILQTVVPQQLYVAAGGCGAAAKSSNEIGRLAAMQLLGD